MSQRLCFAWRCLSFGSEPEGDTSTHGIAAMGAAGGEDAKGVFAHK